MTARSTTPADCYKQVRLLHSKQTLGDESVFELCATATSLAPAKCFASAGKHLSNKEKVSYRFYFLSHFMYSCLFTAPHYRSFYAASFPTIF
jgi:hypothetical protein